VWGEAVSCGRPGVGGNVERGAERRRKVVMIIVLIEIADRWLSSLASGICQL
jgi:hypothetical protein